MSGAVCNQCGSALAPGSSFCGQCGATQPPAAAATLPGGPAPAAHEASGSPKRTVFGLASPLAGAATVQPAAEGQRNKQTVIGMASPLARPPSPAPAAGPAGVGKQTMVGIFAPSSTTRPAEPAAASPAPAGRTGKQTMVGIAAPLAPAQPPAPAAPALGRAASSTIVGVAVPGIAPTSAGSGGGPGPAQPPGEGRYAPQATVALPVQYVPAPAPFAAHPAPPAPVIVTRRGLPLARVALATAGLLVIGGIALALLWHGAPPMTAQARTTADGSDALHLACDPAACPDGTTAALGASRATFVGGQAELALPTPLHLGDNELALVVDRPGIGRDETMKFSVPVAYRVRADVTTMSAPRAAVTVRVQAIAGAAVSVDGKPVALDANGAGAYMVDESAATEGPADESRVVTLDLRYVVTPRSGPPESGTVSARVAVAPLRVDAPGMRAVVDEDHVLVAGRGPKGASITVDGNTVAAGADGSFETTVPLASAGDQALVVRASTAALVPRTVRLAVTRVASLADAARDFEGQHPIGYDAAMADLAGKTGQPIVVDGEVVESRSSGHRTLALVDDHRGCANGPCLARVVIGRDLALAHGDLLRACGVVARPFTTPAGQTVPEIDAQLALRTHK